MDVGRNDYPFFIIVNKFNNISFPTGRNRTLVSYQVLGFSIVVYSLFRKMVTAIAILDSAMVATS